MTHNTDPDVSAERDYVARTLAAAPGVARLTLVGLPQVPRRGVDDQGDRFYDDARVLLVELAGPAPSIPRP